MGIIQMNFFTSDEHYGHKNIITFQKRPFASVEEMNEAMIKNSNSIVEPNDIVYHVGDFSFCNPDDILKRLTGKHILITGSHDYKKGTLWHRVYQNVCEIRIEGEPTMGERLYIFLSHYAHRRWPRSHYGAWHLFGHSHGNLEPFGYSFDVGVDTHNFKPYSFDEIKERMSKVVVTEYKIYSSKDERE